LRRFVIIRAAATTGPIVGLYETEEKFRAAGKNIVSLRPNEFMENVFFSLPTILAQDSIYTSIPGSVKAPFIATQDIAEVAAEFLLKPIEGHHVVDIVGPQEISFDEWARITGQAIGKQIRVVTVPGDQLKAAMSQAECLLKWQHCWLKWKRHIRKYKGNSKANKNASVKLHSRNLPGRCSRLVIGKPSNRRRSQFAVSHIGESDVWDWRVASSRLPDLKKRYDATRCLRTKSRLHSRLNNAKNALIWGHAVSASDSE
jgi:hypothetical protein